MKIFNRLFPSAERRAFNRMHRRHRRELVKLARKTYEYDYGWLHESVVLQIQHMYEYYKEGNNVWQTDATKLPILEQLKQVLDWVSEFDEDNVADLDFVHEEIVCRDGHREKMSDIEAKESELYQKIYSYIGQYIQWWWD